jgi:hypothetical protein
MIEKVVDDSALVVEGINAYFFSLRGFCAYELPLSYDDKIIIKNIDNIIGFYSRTNASILARVAVANGISPQCRDFQFLHRAVFKL